MGALKLTYQNEKPTLKVVKGVFSNEEKSCAGVYRYGFNGYEKDNEVKNITGGHISFNDYGYDPRTGKRWNVDPKTSSSPWQSPYLFAANSPIQNIDTDGETDTYYILVVDRKTGKSAFQTATFENNYPDKNHYVIHYKDKDGSVKKVNVNEKTFIKERVAVITKTTLFPTRKFNKVEKSSTGDEGSPEYIPDDESNSSDNGDSFSFFTELLKAMGIGNATVMEGPDNTPIKIDEDLEKSSSSSTKTKTQYYSIVFKRTNGDIDTIDVVRSRDTTAIKEVIEKSSSTLVGTFKE